MDEKERQEAFDLGFDEWKSVTSKDKDEQRKKTKQRVKQAKEKKKVANKSPDELWKEIFARKNNDKDRERLKEVYQAWTEGLIEPRAKLTKAEALRMYARLAKMQKGEKIRNMVETTPSNYHLINTVEQLDWVCKLWESENIIGIDTETTGLDIVQGSDYMVGLSISFPQADEHVYIPTRHQEGEQLDNDYVMKELKPFLSNKHRGKVLHNAKFDAHVFAMEGIKLRGIVMDTMIGIWCLNENEVSYRLKDVANKYAKFLGVNPENDTFGELFGKATFDTIPLDVALVYAAKDTALTVKLFQFIDDQLNRKDLERIRALYYEMENPLLEVCIEMEQAGFLLDMENVQNIREELTKDEERLHKKLLAVFGDINFNSPQQLQKALYDDLGFKDISKKRSTDKKTLKKLSEQHKEAELLLEYRKISKLRSSFIDKLPELVKSTGRVYGQFNQAATSTGRFASKNPNLQQLPPKARTIFIAPNQKIIIGSDFSQIEPRVLAHITGDEELKRPYIEGGDLYATLAAKTFGFDIEYCLDGAYDPTGTFQPRKRMKTGLLAVMYGTTMFTLANQLEITVDEADKFIKDFFVAYPSVKKWIEGIHVEVKNNEFVETLFGRKRRFPNHKQDAVIHDKLASEICERLGVEEVPNNVWEYKDELPYKLKRQFQIVKGKVGRVRRQAVNAIIQGSAADIMKIAMNRLFVVSHEEGFTILATVHDEALLECPKTITKEQIERIEKAMTGSIDLDVPLKVDVAFMYEWGNETSKDDWFAAA